MVVGVLDEIWQSVPDLKDMAGCTLLRQHRFSHSGKPAVWSINTDWWNESDLEEMKLLGSVPLSDEELQLAYFNLHMLPGSRLSTLSYANYAAEGEWRWANDRDALIAEQEQVRVKQAAKAAAEAERYKNRLSKLTWEQLLGETPFERWTPSPPFPSAEFAHLARKVVHDTCRALSSLGSKPRKPEVRRILRECVEWFNQADEQAGGVIETEEREDICNVLEEMIYITRHKSLIKEIDEWRTW